MEQRGKKHLNSFDSDPRLHPNHWEIGGKSGKMGRVSVKVSVAALPRYNLKRTRPLLAIEAKSGCFIVIT